MRAVPALAAIAALALLCSPARACPIADAMTPMLFEELPAVPPGAVAARVVILADDPRHAGTRGRILAMLVGDYAGTMLRLEPAYYTSCDRFPQPGDAGIVVGRILSSTPDELVVDPIRAPSPLQAPRPIRVIEQP